MATHIGSFSLDSYIGVQRGGLDGSTPVTGTISTRTVIIADGDIGHYTTLANALDNMETDFGASASPSTGVFYYVKDMRSLGADSLTGATEQLYIKAGIVVDYGLTSYITDSATTRTVPCVRIDQHAALINASIQYSVNAATTEAFIWLDPSVTNGGLGPFVSFYSGGSVIGGAGVGDAADYGAIVRVEPSNDAGTSSTISVILGLHDFSNGVASIIDIDNTTDDINAVLIENCHVDVINFQGANQTGGAVTGGIGPSLINIIRGCQVNQLVIEGTVGRISTPGSTFNLLDLTSANAILTGTLELDGTYKEIKLPAVMYSSFMSDAKKIHNTGNANFALPLPLHDEAPGAVTTGVGLATQLDDSAAAFGDLTTIPHSVVVTSGTRAGETATISSNTATQLTHSALTGAYDSGETYEVYATTYGVLPGTYIVNSDSSVEITIQLPSDSGSISGTRGSKLSVVSIKGAGDFKIGQTDAAHQIYGGDAVETTLGTGGYITGNAVDSITLMALDDDMETWATTSLMGTVVYT